MQSATVALCAVSLAVGIAIGYMGLGAIGGDLRPDVPSLSDALGEEDLLIRSQLLGRFLQTLGPENLEEALASLNAGIVGVTDQELRIFMLAWGRFDPPGALRWAWAQDTDWAPRLEKAAFYAWGFRDPQAALTELETRASSGKRGSSLEKELISGWRVNGDVDGLTAHLISMPASRERETMVSALLAQMGKEGPDVVIAWADAIPVDGGQSFKQLAFNRGVSAVARTDARAAADWYEAHREQDYAVRALAVIARRWVDYHEPTELLVWMGDLPPIPGRSFDAEQAHGIGQGMKWWLRRDPDAAQRWLGSFSAVPAVFDPAIASLAQYLLKQNPESAVAWADRIQHEKLRSETLTKSVGRWWKRDKDAAEEWLATAELNDEARAKILSGKVRSRAKSIKSRRR
jgi:hypothetical protein